LVVWPVAFLYRLTVLATGATALSRQCLTGFGVALTSLVARARETCGTPTSLMPRVRTDWATAAHKFTLPHKRYT
jgi:hypothetical protein